MLLQHEGHILASSAERLPRHNITSTSLRARTRSFGNYLRLIHMISGFECQWCVISCLCLAKHPSPTSSSGASLKSALQLLLYNYTNTKNHRLRLHSSSFFYTLISNCLLHMTWPHCYFSLFVSKDSIFSEGLTYLLLTPTATCCYITMIITKHPLSWRCLVPYIYFRNIRRRLHNQTYIMSWYSASCLLLFCSEVRQSIHHFDRNCVNKQPIPLVQRPTSIASTMIERVYIVS